MGTESRVPIFLNLNDKNNRFYIRFKERFTIKGW